ncbi:hypothetical protein NC651_004424 [Populus alba x Populus x berolinensis]|nr:hypothetical protein NC651_004424 [Populus alba x Populus x berolinensis]
MRAIHNNFCTKEFLISNLIVGSWGLFSSLYNGEPFKQNMSIDMKKKRFVFFRVSTTIERANHNGEQKGNEL